MNGHPPPLLLASALHSVEKSIGISNRQICVMRPCVAQFFKATTPAHLLISFTYIDF